MKGSQMGCVPAALKTGSPLNVAHGSSCEMRPATRYHLCGSEELQSIDMKRTKDIAKIATPRSVVHPVSPDERAEAGKALAQQGSHGSIRANRNEVNRRPNPIDSCTSQMLVELNGLILQLPFAFYRGQLRRCRNLL